MSPYATHLAHARIDALRQLVAALNQAETPDEKRRCAVAIFNAPDPCDLDDEIELDDEENVEDDSEDVESDDAAKNSDDIDHAATLPEFIPQSVPHASPPSVAALSNRRCDVATPSHELTPASIPTRPPLHPSLALFIPASTTPASKLIAISGTASSLSALPPYPPPCPPRHSSSSPSATPAPASRPLLVRGPRVDWNNPRCM